MDQIDTAAGLRPGSAAHALRRERTDIVEAIEQCRASLLMPEDGLGISGAVRAALCARIARHNGQEALAAAYDRQLAGAEDAGLVRLAAGDPPESTLPLAAMVRHVDRVAVAPQSSTSDDIEALAAAGLSNPQIVALSELIAFAAFEGRVVAGLQLLGQPS